MKKLYCFYKKRSFIISAIIMAIGAVNYFMPFYFYGDPSRKLYLSSMSNFDMFFYIAHRYEEPYKAMFPLNPANIFDLILQIGFLLVIVYSIFLFFARKKFSILPSAYAFIYQTITIAIPVVPFIGYFISIALLAVSLALKYCIIRYDTIPKFYDTISKFKVTAKAKIKRKPTKSERIAQLEQRLSELEQKEKTDE